MTNMTIYQSRRKRIIQALLDNPDMHYKLIAEALGVNATYVSQVKCDIKHRAGAPRNRGNSPRVEYVTEQCETRVSDWFIDKDGCRTRWAVGTPVQKVVMLGRPPLELAPA